jgi:threonine/homoserine/homoserine lactone efflux protein
MSLAAFLAAVLALLVAPGPTNTLMALSGAQGGLPRVIRLMPAELAGYLAAILSLAALGAPLLAAWPAARPALALVAAVWVMALAIRLWGRRGDDQTAPVVTPRQVFVTTLLNPKALVFALVLLPPLTEPDFAMRLGLFVGVVAGVAALWGMAGAAAGGRRAGGNRLGLVQRGASVWLALVSVSLALGVLRA